MVALIWFVLTVLARLVARFIIRTNAFMECQVCTDIGKLAFAHELTRPLDRKIGGQ
jgi:hypothetical protein